MSINSPCLIVPSQQIISTSVGAMCTALFMTPFDVVRVRMQSQFTQTMHNECYVFRVGVNDHVCTCFNQAESISWNNRSMKYHGTIDTFFKIARNEGIPTLWSGLSPTLIMSLPSTIIYYSCYEQLKCLFGYKNDLSNSLIPGIAGGCARISATTITNPLELIRTKKMSANLSYKDLSNTLKELVESGGFRSLWRGLIPSLWRDVPFSIFYWSTYERLKIFIMQKSRLKQMPSAFCSGVIAGALATIFTHPFDTVKSIRQVQIGQNERQANERTIQLLQRMFREIGISSWYKGLVPRLLKVSPACAIMITTIEFFRENVF